LRQKKLKFVCGPGHVQHQALTGLLAQYRYALLIKLLLDFTGHSFEYIVSDERTTGDVASVLGNEVGKPQLPWVGFSDEQTLGGLLQAGLPEEIAKNYVEMGASIRNGLMNKHYFDNKPAVLQPTKLEDFAPAFAAVYHQAKPEAITV
jgi:hypothetical protein